MKIYILDDKDYYVNILKDRLEKKGYIVLVNTDPYEAKNEIINISDIDLLIIDYNMPLINGLDFLKELEKKDNIDNKKIIMMANDIPDDKIPEIKKYTSNIIFKPFILDDLEQNIDFLFKDDLHEKDSKIISSEISTFKQVIENMRHRIDQLEKEVINKNIRLEEKDQKILQLEENQILYIDKLKTTEGQNELAEQLKYEIVEKDKIIQKMENDIDNMKRLIRDLKDQICSDEEEKESVKEIDRIKKDLNIKNDLLKKQNEDLNIKNLELEVNNLYYRAYIFYKKGSSEKALELVEKLKEIAPENRKAIRLEKNIKKKINN